MEVDRKNIFFYDINKQPVTLLFYFTFLHIFIILRIFLMFISLASLLTEPICLTVPKKYDFSIMQ